MEQLATILKDVKVRSGADAALLISADGLVLETVNGTGIDMESLAAYAASSVMVSERMGETVEFGTPESVIVFYRGRALVISPVGPIVAVLVGAEGTPPGALRLHLRRATHELSDAMHDELRAVPAAG